MECDNGKSTARKKGTGPFFRLRGHLRGQVLLFAFIHTNAIYTNTLCHGRPRSFYKWAGERGNLILKIGDINVAFILTVRF